ncbi:FtsX-like permease family protein [Paenibacillus sp. MER 99-2]|uniref:ABC transporter permease n=1 Tax=Paenibacillus sp. MER 99-2 TaxID=2939572 RepID=UPI00203F01FF|nr:FtsX-like permease family protein [Paenibacillus sp. MER 99-2]MCM3171602.1 FtsX-like permease family protein [Paenibacillus sp. MER 99-2]
MLARMLQNEFRRKKGITLTLFMFVLLAAILVASGTRMIMELSTSIQHLFTESKTPHVVQMHSGELDRNKVSQWTQANDLVAQHQIVDMINVDGSHVYFGAESEKGSIMDMDFVVQNKDFDYLLNMNNEIIQVNEGEIAVPVYYLQEKQLQLGDSVVIQDGSFNRSYRIVDFVRDAQMNPSIIHSKRFVISPQDFQMLKQRTGETEYLIEFRLVDPNKTNEFIQTYQNADLPNSGPLVTYSLFQLLNALTDGVVAAVIIMVSLILIVIAVCCIRFTMLATIEEDYREISVMKAIGVSGRDIRTLYLSKYVVIAGLACIVGYLSSIYVNRLFTSNIMLYMGSAPATWLNEALSLFAVITIFAIVLGCCILVLRRFNQISAIEGLRSGSLGDTDVSTRKLSLSNSRWSRSVPVFLALQDVIQRKRLYRLLLLVFTVSSLIIIVPVNFLNTLRSPSFISYMGVGQSDIRIDLRYSEDVEQRYAELLEHVRTDSDVLRYSPLVTTQFNVRNNEGGYDQISVETGDFSIFPLSYLSGLAPKTDNEIALSDANSRELDKKVGDSIVLMVEDREKTMVVSGIYQDVTNGGKTAKALLPYDKNRVLWYVVSLDLKDASQITDKIAAYEQAFSPAKVTDLQGYLHQTLGGTIDQLKRVTIAVLVVAVLVSILITSLFLRMLVAKDHGDIAILRSLGFALSNIRLKYVMITLIVLGIGVLAGTILANTAGPLLISAIMSSFGASHMEFVINPLQAYILCPLLLASAITIAALLSIQSIREASIVKMIVE